MNLANYELIKVLNVIHGFISDPVTKVKLEVLDLEHNLLAESTLPIAADQKPVMLTNGQYMVKLSPTFLAHY